MVQAPLTFISTSKPHSLSHFRSVEPVLIHLNPPPINLSQQNDFAASPAQPGDVQGETASIFPCHGAPVSSGMYSLVKSIVNEPNTKPVGFSRILLLRLITATYAARPVTTFVGHLSNYFTARY